MNRTKEQQLEERVRELELQLSKIEPVVKKGTIYGFKSKKFGTIDFVGMFQGPKELIGNRRKTHVTDSIHGY
jgi:hypothetical protein